MFSPVQFDWPSMQLSGFITAPNYVVLFTNM